MCTMQTDIPTESSCPITRETFYAAFFKIEKSRNCNKQVQVVHYWPPIKEQWSGSTIGQGVIVPISKSASIVFGFFTPVREWE
jgi:hypothetical protein